MVSGIVPALVATAVAAALLVGCAPEKEVVSVPTCPPSFVAWPPALQQRMAAGLRAMPADANAAAVRLAVRQMLGLRAELRAAGCVPRPTVDEGDAR